MKRVFKIGATVICSTLLMGCGWQGGGALMLSNLDYINEWNRMDEQGYDLSYDEYIRGDYDSKDSYYNEDTMEYYDGLYETYSKYDTTEFGNYESITVRDLQGSWLSKNYGSLFVFDGNRINWYKETEVDPDNVQSGEVSIIDYEDVENLNKDNMKENTGLKAIHIEMDTLIIDGVESTPLNTDFLVMKVNEDIDELVIVNCNTFNMYTIVKVD